ncbi:MAG: HlyD family efflux transporter periplasmic adaptor subunit [Lewinellaceae bacterium]|nr:HlyD family efflux transporter periplasmic adaptor subunit [Lewinellaceae bacterium]HPQ99429.1 HlyD family efflux transporter periplasmic adaptor subunit [Saprospiraceae bacterium]
MLNISENSVREYIDQNQLRSMQMTDLLPANRMLKRFLLAVLAVVLVVLFLPWRQNIQAKGKLTTLNPDQRPQTIHSTIAGRIEKWYVAEGQMVHAGDTIVHLSEIKTEYFDPQLVDRLNQQIEAKTASIHNYDQKVLAMDDQIASLRNELQWKQKQLANKQVQTELKVSSALADQQQIIVAADIADFQFRRADTLFQKGIISLTDLENKKQKKQETSAKLNIAANKLEEAQRELENIRLEANTQLNEYQNKIAKAESDRFSTLSSRFDAAAEVQKLQIQYQNYKTRNTFYYILAPQDCYITKALKPGIGETIKEGDAVVSIMPSHYNLAVDWYITPPDMPLIQLNQEVRFIFDGWPAIVFKGWPDASYGTFRGKVVAIDNTISDGGVYRILVAPDPNAPAWPEKLRMGSGAKGIALLNQVPVWYEIWRKLNGFPPDYYQPDTSPSAKDLKAPVKSIVK